MADVDRRLRQVASAHAAAGSRWADRQRRAAAEIEAVSATMRDAGSLLAEDVRRSQLAATAQSPVVGLLRGLLAEFSIHGASRDQSAITVGTSRTLAANRVRRTVSFLRSMPETAAQRLVDVPTPANSAALKRQAERQGRTGRLARTLSSPTAQTFARRFGVVGGVYGTVTGTTDLIRQGNPVEAFKERGTHYAEDVAGTAFSASTAALLLAPNPVTAGAVVVTGGAYVGLSVWNRREKIADTERNATRKAGEALNRAGDSVKQTAQKVASSAPVSQALDTGKTLVKGATSSLKRLNPFGS